MSELDIIPAESLPSVSDSQPLDLDPEGQQLRALAQKADYGEINQEDTEAAAPEGEKPEASTTDDQQRAADAEQKTEAVKSDSPEASAERDERGRFKPKVKAQAPETPYTKAQKEQERQKSVLANFEEEKKRERAAIAQERQELRQQLAQLQQLQQQRPQQQAQGPRFSSQHLVQAVDEFEATALKAINEGDTETAQKNMDLARKARVAAQESYFAEQQEQYKAQEAQVSQAWQANAARVIAEHEELKDMSSEPAKRVSALINHPDLEFLKYVPNGFPLAAKYVANEMAAEASGLKDEKIASLEKQLKELQERTGLSGSGPTPRSERSVDDMSLEEQGQALRRQVADQDRMAYA